MNLAKIRIRALPLQIAAVFGASSKERTANHHQLKESLQKDPAVSSKMAVKFPMKRGFNRKINEHHLCLWSIFQPAMFDYRGVLATGSLPQKHL